MTDEMGQRGSRVRRAYSPPTLVDYGAVSKLTQGSLAVNNDAVTGMTMAACL